MKLTRRKFLKLGAVGAALIALEKGNFPLKAIAKELEKGGADVKRTGIDWGKAGKSLKAIPSTCLQCGNTDGIIGFVENDRLLKLEGNPKHPNTRGRLCAKGQAGIHQVYDPFRIKWPMVRVGERGDPNAKWKRISLDEAISEVAKRLKEIRESGDPGRFAFHQGRNRFPQFTKRFTNAMGTRHYFEHTSVCEASLKVGYETSFGQDLDTSDAARAKYMLDFGSNIYECAYMHHHLAQRIVEGRYENGAKYVSFDPRLSNTAGRADEWFPIRVGTDAAVMLAMANVIMQEGLADTDFLDNWTTYPTDKLAVYLQPFTPQWASKISGVPAADIKRIAIEFAQVKPRCFARAYNGISNHTNGAYNARCLAMLNAVVGNIDQPGGFCLMKFTGFGKVEPEPDITEVLKEIGATGAKFPIEEDHEEKYPLASHGADHLLPLRLKRLNYKLKFYMLHQYNPMFINPDQELWLEVFSNKKYVEFILDFSPFWSETAKLVADMIIPDVTYMERLQVNDMPSVENIPFIQLWQPIVEPLYESQSLYDSLLQIAKKIGGGMEKYFAFDKVEDYVRQSVEAKWGPGSYERLKTDGVLIGKSYDPKTYKSFDQLSEEEKAKMRQFNTFAQRLGSEDLAKLSLEGANVPNAAAATKVGEAKVLSAPIKDKSGKKTLGVLKDGVFYKGFPTPSGLFEIYSPQLKEHGFNSLPAYVPVKRLQNLDDDQLVLITGKWNVHTQSRTQNTWLLMEIVGYNPAWINPQTARKRGLKEGDEIIIESDWGAKKIPSRIHITEGIHPKAIFVSTSLGHWEYGPLANEGKNPFNTKQTLWSLGLELPGTPFEKGFARRTTSTLNPVVPPAKFLVSNPVRVGGNDLVKATASPVVKDYKNRTTVGWIPNSILPSDEAVTDPVGGEYAWSNTPVRVRKV